MVLTEKVIGAFKLKCKGIDRRGEHLLTKDKEESIIVTIYENGLSKVFCRHRKGPIYCNLAQQEFEIRENGVCPYKVSA